MDIKKLILISLLLPFLLIVGTGMYNLVGMASVEVSYKCTDHDVFSSEPITTKGIVTVTSNAGERSTYTDYCLDSKTIREYSCDPDTNQQTYSEESCMYEQVCYLGRCMTK
jgi:hypothetical protein